jgi:hypothetical protein
VTDPARWSGLNESERALLRAALRYRDITPEARHDHTCDVIDALSREAVALTSDDPPPAPIEMPDLPDGWERNAYGCLVGPEGGMLAVDNGNLVYEEDDSGCSAWIELDAVAFALRSAGWRVEAPHG